MVSETLFEQHSCVPVSEFYAAFDSLADTVTQAYSGLLRLTQGTVRVLSGAGVQVFCNDSLVDTFYYGFSLSVLHPIFHGTTKLSRCACVCARVCATMNRIA